MTGGSIAKFTDIPINLGIGTVLATLNNYTELVIKSNSQSFLYSKNVRLKYKLKKCERFKLEIRVTLYILMLTSTFILFLCSSYYVLKKFKLYVKKFLKFTRNKIKSYNKNVVMVKFIPIT